MNAEYQRLEAEASEVQRQMRTLSTTVELSSASGHATFERQICDLGRKLASLHHGMALIQATDSSEMRRIFELLADEGLGELLLSNHLLPLVSWMF